VGLVCQETDKNIYRLQEQKKKNEEYLHLDFEKTKKQYAWQGVCQSAHQLCQVSNISGQICVTQKVLILIKAQTYKKNNNGFKKECKRYRDRRVGGRWILSITERRGLYRDSLGFAHANTEVRAFNEAIIPAFAIDTVCCSITCILKIPIVFNHFKE
jgi:hypothetical protein